jgi:hypothetical protein
MVKSIKSPWLGHGLPDIHKTLNSSFELDELSSSAYYTKHIQILSCWLAPVWRISLVLQEFALDVFQQ